MARGDLIGKVRVDDAKAELSIRPDNSFCVSIPSSAGPVGDLFPASHWTPQELGWIASLRAKAATILLGAKGFEV